jgi:subfamily B ATP-binding cassette protein MsbA
MAAFLRRVWALARPYRTRLILGLIFSVLFALSNLLLVSALKLVPDVLFPKPDTNPVADWLQSTNKHLPDFMRRAVKAWVPDEHSKLSQSAVILIISILPVAMLLRGLFGYLNIYLMNWAAVRAVADLRLKLFDHLQNLSLNFFHTARTGNLISRIISDTTVLHSTIAYSFSTMIKDPVTIISLLVLLLCTQRDLTLISAIVFPICIVPVLIYGRKVRKSAKAAQAHLADLADVMHETFTGNRIVKAYNLEKTTLERFRASVGKYVGQYMRILRAQEIPGPVIEFFGSIGVVLVCLYINAHKPNALTAGDLASFLASVFLMYQPIKSIGRLQNQLEQARAASERIFGYLDEKSSVIDPVNPVPLQAAKADIVFENVEFKYGEQPILRGINLTVKAGQMVALVGNSGSGKTTIANLLLRFYDPQAGSVRIGDTNIRQVSMKDLRAHVALVTQETILFNDTVRNNIALGRSSAKEQDIMDAARHAFAHQFIAEKEAGYETLVGEKGVTLSGGQKQRIAIARAILKDAPILVLDEATSALDAESERAVQAALEELMQGRTTICIAHRLSTIQKADLIVVLDQGRIVEMGSHAELIQARGIYRKLYELHSEPDAA